MTNLLPRIEFWIQAWLRRDERCPHCANTATERIARKHLVVRIRRCPNCSLCFTDPLYDRSFFGRLYDHLYAGEGSTTRLPDAETLARLKQSGFRGNDKDCAQRLHALRSLVQGDRLLELGSSWGYFLFQAERAGLRATGVEISGPRREFGERELGVSMVSSLAELGEERFDVVYSAHTLEHLTDLSFVLSDIHGRLKPGGLLALEVPHFDYAQRGRSALAAMGAVHPLGFTSSFFQRSLPQVGFRIQGFFDRWEDVPGVPKPASTGDVVIVLAARPLETLEKAAA